MVWSQMELAEEIGTNLDTLRQFLQAIHCEIRKVYTDEDARHIADAWIKTGAQSCMEDEGDLILSDRHRSYRDALDSVESARARFAAKQRDGWKCRICSRADVVMPDGSMSGTDAHHTHYSWVGRDREKDSLVTLCRSCHDRIHRKQA